MRLPLHGKGNSAEILDMHMWAARVNPSGYRPAPTSKKNRLTHKKGPVTLIERLAHKVYPK